MQRSEGMLTVEHYELIRRKVLIDGLGQRVTAKELGDSRKTVAKALVLRLPPGYRRSEPRAHPVIDPVKGIIDAWLEQNVKTRPKQRQTAQRIYERLRDEYGFTGHYGTVQRYVREAAHRQKEVFMPLEFEPGEEAQVDWHEGWIVENGLERKCQFFVMRLCYSKATFVYPYEKANLESFLDGHVRAFEYFGGVPRRIAYDNLQCAVIYVGKGQNRRLTKRFQELRAWYLFETRFCNIAKGNEKGDVANGCKRSERTYLSPVPQVDRVRILCAHQEVAVHERCYTAGQFVLEPRHYLKLLERKPGSLDNARPFQGQPWGESFAGMRKELEYRYPQDGTLRYIQVLLLFTTYPFEQVQAAVDVCVQRRAFREDAVLNVLRNEPLTPRRRLDLSDRPELIPQDSGIRDVRVYDQLMSREEALV